MYFEEGLINKAEIPRYQNAKLLSEQNQKFHLSDLKNPIVVEVTPLNPSIDKFMCKYLTI